MFPVFMKPEGVKLTRQKMPFEKYSKRGNLVTSQKSENCGPVQAGVQLTVIREGSCWTSEMCRFGDTFGSDDAKCATKGDQKSISNGSQNRAL